MLHKSEINHHNNKEPSLSNSANKYLKQYIHYKQASILTTMQYSTKQITSSCNRALKPLPNSAKIYQKPLPSCSN